MGIRGLNWFLHTYPVPLLEDIDICNTTVVIDGSELLFHLYFECGQVDFRCGGDYTSFRVVIREFVDVLNHCGIRPFVVFDGFKSENNIQRYLEVITRNLGHIRELVNRGSTGRKVKPLLGKEVLRQTLEEVSVPFIVIPGDADAEIAAIANSLDAMVLASDTDFCIFQLKRGFLFFDDFKWQEVKESDVSCRSKIFRQSILEKTFGTPVSSLCVLEPLMSHQDGIVGVNFQDFIKSLPMEVRIPDYLRRMRYQRPNWIECAMIWLKSYRNDDQIIRKIRIKFSNFSEAKFKDCLRIYQELPNVDKYLDSLRSGGDSADVKPNLFETVGGMTEPVNFLPIMVDNPEMPSSHIASSSIRKSLYELGCIIKFTEEDNANVRERHIVEIDRVDQIFKEKKISVQVPDFEQVGRLHLRKADEELKENFSRNEMTTRQEYLFKVILQNEKGFDPNCLGTDNELLASSIYYWARCLSQRPSNEVCKALAVTFSCGYYEIANESLKDDFCRFPDNSFDKEALHFSAQWQVIVCEAMRLNSLLGCPVSNPKIGMLFSGKFFQKAYAFLVQNKQLSDEDISDLLFQSSERANSFFIDVMRIMLE